MTKVLFTGYFNISILFASVKIPIIALCGQTDGKENRKTAPSKGYLVYSYFTIAITYLLLKYQKKIWIKSEENWICKSFYA